MLKDRNCSNCNDVVSVLDNVPDDIPVYCSLDCRLKDENKE